MRPFIATAAITLMVPAQASEVERFKTLERHFQQQQTALTPVQHQAAPIQSDLSGLTFSSYGSVALRNAVVYQNVQDTGGERRTQADLERVVTEFGYQFNPRWNVEVEIEYEHGGTGTTLEFDGFEEFGEFESEVEAGGEVIVEKAQVAFTPGPELGIKFGRIHVPVGLLSNLHKPNQYLTASRPSSIESLIPSVWHETGISLFGQWQALHYQAQLVTGLNSEYFRSYGWVGSGHQRRFETVNADAPAVVLNLDWGDIKGGTAVGASLYFGNTSGNRHKPNKLDVDGALTLIDLHAAFVEGPWVVRAQYLYGQLDDADAITLANKNTPGLNPGNFAQVGSEAQAWYVEAGVNVGHWLGWTSELVLYVNLDHSNPLKATESGSGSERFTRTGYSAGLNYQPIPQLILKSEFGLETVAQNTIPDTQFMAVSLGYQLSL